MAVAKKERVKYSKAVAIREALRSGELKNGAEIKIDLRSHKVKGIVGWIDEENEEWFVFHSNSLCGAGATPSSHEGRKAFEASGFKYSYEVTTDTDYPVFFKQMTEKEKARRAAEGKKMFDSVILAEEKKEEIMAAVSQIHNTEKIFKEWGFEDIFEKGTAVALLFYGKPGTGKTLMAEALAKYLGRKLKLIQTAEVESMEPGGAERAIREYFKYADKNNEVLLFDECDSLIYNRNSVGAIMAAQVNALLSSLEQYKGVAIFTTNRLGHLDDAFERRVSAKVEFPKPTRELRELIWKRMIPSKAPIAKDVDFSELARIPIAGGNIKNVVLNAARTAAYRKLKEINNECFMEALEKEVSGIKGFKSANKELEGTPYVFDKSSGNGGGVSKSIEKVKDSKKESSAKQSNS